eukprot:275377_1
MLTSHSSPIRSKRFAFTPNYAIKNEFADPNIVSTLMTLGDKLRNHKYCEEAVLSTNNHSTELALKWILKRMTQSKQTASITSRITQSTTVSSPILVAISPKQSKQNRNKYKTRIFHPIVPSTIPTISPSKFPIITPTKLPSNLPSKTPSKFP